MARPVIAASLLRRHYSLGGGTVRALDGVSLSVAAGEFVAVQGRSGAGKSTLLHVLGLLETPDAGDYSLDGQPTATLTEPARAGLRNRAIGFVFQFPVLLARISASDNVALPLLYAGIASAQRRRMATEALDMVGLGHRAAHWPEQLSGGERQRVGIARAIVARPSLILADEPTGALDSATADGIMALFDRLHHAGHTIVLVTHDAEVARHAERRLVLRDGRLDAPAP